LRVGLGVYRVAGPDLTSMYDDNAYLILSDKCHILIDSGSGFAVDAMLRNILYLVEELKEIKYLILTHAHHRNFGGAYYLKELISDLITIAHYLDSTYIRNPDKEYCKVISELGEPKPVVISLEIYENTRKLSFCNEEIEITHIPIHTRGSIGVFLTRGGLIYGFVGGLIEEIFSRELSPEEKNHLFKVMGGRRIDVLCHSRGCLYGYDKITTLLSY